MSKPFCTDCPDRESCGQGMSCEFVKETDRRFTREGAPVPQQANDINALHVKEKPVPQQADDINALSQKHRPECQTAGGRGLPCTCGKDLKQSGDLLTVQEVADIFRVSKMTVYRMVHDGSLGSVRIGRSYRIPRGGVDYILGRPSGRTPC